MKLLRYVGLAALVIVLLMTGLIGFAPTWLRLGLDAYGIENVAFEDLSLGLEGATLRGLTIGQPIDQSVDQIALDYSLTKLMSGRIDRVMIKGLSIKTSLDDLASDSATSDKTVAPTFLIPTHPSIGKLVIENSEIDLETPIGNLLIPLNGQIAAAENRIAFALRSEEARLGDLENGIIADLNMDGSVTLDDGRGLDELAASGQLSLNAANAVLPNLGSIKGEGKVTVDVQGPMSALQGSMLLDLDALSWFNDAYAIEEATLDQALDLTFDGQSLDLSLAEQGRISITQLRATDQVKSGWFTIKLYPEDELLFSLDVEKKTWQHRLKTEIDPVRLETEAGQWWARIENLVINGTGTTNGPLQSNILIKQGRADLPSANLALVGIGSAVRLTADGLSQADPISVTINSLRPLNKPAAFPPLRLNAVIKPTAEQIAFDGNFTTKTRPALVLDFTGTHHPQTEKGHLNFDLEKFAFQEDGLQPGDFSPLLREALSDTVGQLAVAGMLGWQDGKLTSSADLLIEELGLTIGPARLERINTLLQFDSLVPLTMTSEQELAIGLLDVGLPLTDGLVALKLASDGKLAVNRLTWRFADGRVGTQPFTFGSDVEDLTLVLDVDQLDLNGLLNLTRLDGLSGEGRIDGTLPLTINETVAIINDGNLEATGAGVLRYDPSGAPGALQAGGAGVGLMLQALENFRYEKLNITLDGRTDGNTEIGLHLRGANPDLQDGHPIEFNLDLEGNLANIIQTNLSNYQIPDRIRERVQGFQP